MLKASSIDIIMQRILTFNPEELFLGDEISPPGSSLMKISKAFVVSKCKSLYIYMS